MTFLIMPVISTYFMPIHCVFLREAARAEPCGREPGVRRDPEVRGSALREVLAAARALRRAVHDDRDMHPVAERQIDGGIVRDVRRPRAR